MIYPRDSSGGGFLRHYLYLESWGLPYLFSTVLTHIETQLGAQTHKTTLFSCLQLQAVLDNPLPATRWPIISLQCNDLTVKDSYVIFMNENIA